MLRIIITYLFLLSAQIYAKSTEDLLPQTNGEKEIYNYLQHPRTAMSFSEFKGTITPLMQKIITTAKSFNPLEKKCFYDPACMLLYGAPLSGKSRIAHLLAHELNAAFFDFLSPVFVRYCEKRGCSKTKCNRIRYLFKYLRNYPTRVVLVLKHLDELLYPADNSNQYYSVLRVLKDEFRKCNEDPRRNVYVFATSSNQKIRVPALYDTFNFHVYLCDFPDEKTREELFLLEAERHNIPLSRETAKKIANTTYGCTIYNIENMAREAKNKAGSNLVTDKEWIESSQGCFRASPCDIALYGKLPQSPPWFHRAWGICSRYASNTGIFIKAIIAKVCFALAKLAYFFKH